MRRLRMYAALPHVSLRAGVPQVYSGRASASDISHMVFGGRIHVKGMRGVMDLGSFAQSFDFASERWVAFYARERELGARCGAGYGGGAAGRRGDGVALPRPARLPLGARRADAYADGPARGATRAG